MAPELLLLRECELTSLELVPIEPGVLDRLGAEKGPVWVGVMARVDAAMGSSRRVIQVLEGLRVTGR